jgi:hypothetical protein
VILKDVFALVGRWPTLLNLSPVAIRTAQFLGYDDEERLSELSRQEAEISRRMWWSLVLADWLLPQTLDS